jgi:predicted choloylglycine hydrolase
MLGAGLLLLVCSWSVAPAGAAESFRYPEGKFGKGRLKYINGLPVLIVEGTPAEIGEQMARLITKPAIKLLDYPKDYLKEFASLDLLPLLVKTGNAMVAQFPADYRKELEVAVKTAGINRDLLVMGNTMFDIKKVAGCSTLIINPERSATGAPLLGRNLDFPTLGYLNKYSLVIVCRPKGKHAFASVGFPGLLGVLSGMNDAGLALATLEVYSTQDGSTKFNSKGVPYALCYRKILEECTTVAEAEKLLRSMKRTTLMNLAVCDKKGGAVFEITTKSVVVRRPEKGICPCTNHFRTKELATNMRCQRYAALEKCAELKKVDLATIAKKLDATNQGKMTLQTMIFEPASLTLHLAIGKCPTSKLALKKLDLRPLLKKSKTE